MTQHLLGINILRFLLLLFVATGAHYYVDKTQSFLKRVYVWLLAFTLFLAIGAIFS